MTCQIILHIGYPKTGTTSLQSFCSSNETFLRHRGVLYPRTGRVRGTHYDFSSAMGLGASGKLHDLAPIDSLLTSLRREADEAGVNRILISSENFILAKDPKKIFESLQEFEVKILIYLRRHDHIFESAYGQSVRSSPVPAWDSSIESYVMHQIGGGMFSYDYLQTLRRWSAAFGKDNMIVRPLEQGQAPDAIYADFLTAIGLTPDDTMKLSARLNSSLSYSTLVAIDAVQRSSALPPFKTAMVAKLVGQDTPAARSTRTRLLSPRNRMSVVAHYRAMYAIIAREFLGRADGVLFEEPAPQPDPAWTPPRQPSLQELAEMLLTAAASLVTPA